MQEQYPSMSTQFDLLSFVQRYLKAIEQGVTGEALAEFYTPDVLQEEYPHRLLPNGDRPSLKQPNTEVKVT
jgi:hypothetical protein